MEYAYYCHCTVIVHITMRINNYGLDRERKREGDNKVIINITLNKVGQFITSS